ncbi:MAG TPA: hypothetical protein DEF45_09520 [Rhodopirellula sp.]|nr:hypothetical protein [Rhodopirellula sp.]
MITLRPVLLILLAFAVVPTYGQQLTSDELKFFEAKIRPVLIRECYGCHSNQSGNVRGGLRLDTRELMLIGGSSGPAIVPGDVEESLLFNAIVHEDFVMPPKRKLSESVINDFRKWIAMGAPDPRVNKISEVQSSITDEDIANARENFWAYQSPQKEQPPRVRNTQWPSTSIDNFILARLEQAGIEPAKDAEAYKVLRRLCFDLIGLPPTLQQINYFEAKWKSSPEQAITHVVDSLLKYDQFGERWGRHWLDVARFAESTGREVNHTYPHAWRYRDYVIDSFNQDKPFNQFVREQIAGDLLPAKSDEQWASNLVATTFLAMGPKNVNERNRVQFAADLIDEQIDATTRVFLGTSVACARCHDHKFDAIPQTDYYALAGVFANANTYWGSPPSEFGIFSTAQTRRQSSLLLLPIEDPNPYDPRYSKKELADLRADITSTIAEASQSRRDRAAGKIETQDAVRNRLRTANRLATLSTKLAVVDENGEPHSYCMGVQEKRDPIDVKLLVRGEIDQPAQTIARGFPKVLCATPVRIANDSSGRLEFANWLGSKDHPLTARVMVNRIWQHMIGQGIVTSTENFGVTGQTPSHPDLLDHLAVEFMESGWSVKSLIRQIANSRVYRMSTAYDEQYHEYDPGNALLWRANPKRLDAEAIRDAMLSISGEIDFDRPRGSEVAKAGYLRVRDGSLGDPRANAREVVERAKKNVMNALQNESGSRGPGSSRMNSFRKGMGRLNAGQSQPQIKPNSPNITPRGRANLLMMQRYGRFGMEGATSSQRELIEAAVREATALVGNGLDMEHAKYRSVYLPIVRDQAPRSLDVFDFADASAVTGVRESSNTANQALYMMNNPFVIRQSKGFASRVKQIDGNVSDQIEFLFLLAYARPPTSGESRASEALLRSYGGQARSLSDSTLSVLCQSLFASAEFRYVD